VNHEHFQPPAERGRTRRSAALLPMIWGLHISRAVYLAAELGVADLLAEGPRTAATLAEVTRTDEHSCRPSRRPTELSKGCARKQKLLFWLSARAGTAAAVPVVLSCGS
jgi:hypothetical protein